MVLLVLLREYRPRQSLRPPWLLFFYMEITGIFSGGWCSIHGKDFQKTQKGKTI